MKISVPVAPCASKLQHGPLLVQPSRMPEFDKENNGKYIRKNTNTSEEARKHLEKE